MDEPIRALIVDNEDGNCKYIENSLKMNNSPLFNVTSVHAQPDKKFAVSENNHDIVLCASFPDGRSEKIIREFNGRIPVIIIANSNDGALAVSAIKAGATNYIVGSAHNFAEMPKIIVRAIKEWRALQEKRKEEKALAAREAQYRNLLDNFGDIFIRVNAEMCITYASGSVINVLKYAPEKLCGKSIKYIDNAGFSNLLERSLSAAVTQKQLISDEYETLSKSGFKYYETRVFPEFDKTGNFISALCVLHDVTEIKRKLKETYSDIQRFQMVARQLPIIVWSTREDLKLDFILSKDVVTKSGKKWTPDDFFRAYGFNKKLNEIHRKALNGEVSIFEVESNLGIFEVRIEPFKNGQGQICGTFGLAYDISARKKVENNRD